MTTCPASAVYAVFAFGGLDICEISRLKTYVGVSGSGSFFPDMGLALSRSGGEEPGRRLPLRTGLRIRRLPVGYASQAGTPGFPAGRERQVLRFPGPCVSANTS